jgi:hypothetical protein
MSAETLSAVAEADDNGHRRRYAPCGLRAYAVAVGEALWCSVGDNRPYTIRELLGDID